MVTTTIPINRFNLGLAKLTDGGGGTCYSINYVHLVTTSGLVTMQATNGVSMLEIKEKAPEDVECARTLLYAGSLKKIKPSKKATKLNVNIHSGELSDPPRAKTYPVKTEDQIRFPAFDSIFESVEKADTQIKVTVCLGPFITFLKALQAVMDPAIHTPVELAITGTQVNGSVDVDGHLSVDLRISDPDGRRIRGVYKLAANE